MSRITKSVLIFSALIAIAPFFQNCAPNFAVQSQFTNSSLSVDPLAPVVMFNVGARNLPADMVVVNQTYSTVNNSVSTLTYTSVPFANCLRTNSVAFTCAASGSVSIKTDPMTTDKVAHETVLNVVSETDLIPEGTNLYASNCASCHANLATSTKRTRTLQQISDSMTTIPEMAALKNLTPTELIALKVVLSGASTPPPAPTPGPTPTQAQALYLSKCSGCHGDYSGSSKRGRDAASISGAIRNNIGGMRTPNLVALTSAEIDMIVEALR